MQQTNMNLSLVKKFKQKAGKIVKINKMILFGSRAKGNFSEESDFDLLIVSNEFEQKPFHKRAIELYAAWGEKYPLELICYTEKEFKQKKANPYSIAATAAKTGINIA